MYYATLRRFLRICRNRHAFRSTVTILLACCALALFGTQPAAAEDAKPVAAPTTPSAGKALVCVYRVYRFTGSATHDNL